MIRSVIPGPDDETTSSMPNDPEQVQREDEDDRGDQPHPYALQPLVAKYLRHPDPPRLRLTRFYDSASGASCQRSTASLSFSP